ncbi:aminopeptidase P family protein [Clostridium botulinum]|uniref:aminopeptidase P family protein n=1 Tax=Clostridium botulinum TaxID=1491 RepID=UPI0004D482A5|nr:aminopeptidase P family protein [Clostridium botulinum]MCD3352211.1 aminopeptidase P family protein [Clostridium botulinum D/C]KEI02399.1 peptidase M24 [Clostridium botulinum C/D str. BKT75002]KEI08273.1 peptidase M24 [Clostridium botulinum C/D str. BKT2873]MCD3361181.1 aminopeptidase P family protein [Clostridium botulinum D/C]MCD3363836.1 aminopeptidase P family protein [Clostridium botulinum D/C]
MNKEFFIKNRKMLSDKLKENSMLVMFAGRAPYKSADETYPFTPNRNFYYLTGIDRENIILIITKRNGNVNEILLIEEEDPIMAKWVGEKIKIHEAIDISGVTNIDYTKNFKEFIGELISRYGYDTLYLDLERQEWGIADTNSQTFAKEVKEIYPYFDIKNIYNEISELRTVKRKKEVEKIRRAIEITKCGIEAMMKNARPGMMEYEIEAYFDYVLTSKGVKDKAFKTIAAAGKNATVLHYSSNNSKCEKDDLIMFDLGAQFQYYNGDITRTFPVSGKFTERQKQIYDVVLRANERIIKEAKPGISYLKLNDIAKKVLAEGCMELGLISKYSEISKYYFHSISHNLGLDTHDVGDRDAVLKPGMVITDEPGLYIPEEGIGIRIEDDLLITEEGCENLSKDIIKTIDEIEEFMELNK